MYVEFVGVPGSGKTAIAEELCSLLKKAGVEYAYSNAMLASSSRLSRAFRRLGAAMQFAARRPFLAAALLADVHASKQRSLSDQRAVAVNILGKCGLMYRVCESNLITISDEGVLHAAWSMLYSANAVVEAEWSHLVKVVTEIAPAKWIVVKVVDEASTSRGRLLDRPGRRNRLARDVLSGDPAAQMRAYRALCQVEQYMQAASKRGVLFKVIEVNNDRFTPSV